MPHTCCNSDAELVSAIAKGCSLQSRLLHRNMKCDKCNLARSQVIFKMLSELAQFSVIFLIVMMGFATCFTALYGRSSVLLEKYGASLASTPDSCEVDELPIYTAFGDFGEALLTLFESMLGEYDFSVFAKYTNDAGDQCEGVPYRSAGVALLVAYLVIMAVMLLNLLIAVLRQVVASDTGRGFLGTYDVPLPSTILSWEEAESSVLVRSFEKRPKPHPPSARFAQLLVLRAWSHRAFYFW